MEQRALIREFRLSERGHGVSCDQSGAFVGPIPLLIRSPGPGSDRWKPRNADQLSKQLSADFGVPVDISSKLGGLNAIANALNDCDLARAQIAVVLLGIPDPPLAKTTAPRDETIRLIRNLYWSGLLRLDSANLRTSSPPATFSNKPEVDGIGSVLTKAGFNPDEPRNDCGEWTSCGASESAGTSSSTNSSIKPIDSKPESLRESLEHGIESAVSEIGQAEISENEADTAAATAVGDSIVSDLRAYANYRAKPWINSAGIPVQVPVFSTGDPFDNQAHLIEHELFEPDAPLMRPGTNADWIDDVVNFGSITTLPVGSGLEALGVGSRVAGGTIDIAEDAPFIIRPLELPPDFDITWPVGRFPIPKNIKPGPVFGNVAHERIGNIFRDAFPDEKIILRTTDGTRGPDIEFPEEAVSRTGFRFGEIKPLSEYGFRSYNGRVVRWDKGEPVLAITYDYNGNIYYGFPW